MTATVSRSGFAKLARWTALIFLGLAMAYAAWAHLVGEVVPEDDAFITYRYVENLVAGKGLVYNEGQRVFGISSPLYAVWLAALRSAFPRAELPDLAVRGNLIFYLATGLGLFLFLRSLTRSEALSAGLSGLFLLRLDLLQASLGGMEPFFFTALVCFVLWSLASGRFVTAALLAGLSALVRPEGALLCAVVLAAWLIASRARPMPALCGLFAPAIIWVIFGFAYYGTPVYHSIIAKSRPLYPLPVAHAFLLAIDKLTFWTVNGIIPRTTRLMQLLPGLIVFTTLTALRFMSHTRRRDHSVQACGTARDARFPFDVMLLVLLLLFYLVTNPYMFVWYYPPIALLWFVGFAAGATALSMLFRNARMKTAAAALLLLFMALPPARVFAARARHGQSIVRIPLDSEAYRLRVRAYRKAAEWLNSVVPAGARLAAPEIGSLGYYYRQGPILDVCGLVSPEAVSYHPIPPDERRAPGTIPSQLIHDQLPDIIVTMARYAYFNLYNNPWFDSAYVLVEQVQLEKPLWGSETVEIFFREDHVADE